MDIQLDPILIERKRIARKRWIVSGCVAVLFGILLWQWTSIRGVARGWRSRRLAAAAEKFLARGEVQKSFETAQSAYFLKSDEVSAMRAVARVLDASGRPAEALPFWKSAFNSSGATFGDRQAFAEDLLRVGALPDSDKIIAELLREQPKSAAILRLSGRLAAAQGRLPNALARIRESLDIDAQNPEGRLLAAVLLVEIGGESERSVALESLWQLTEDESSVGVRALECLAGWKELPPSRTQQLIERLRRRPAPDERLRLLALDVALRGTPEQKEEVLDGAISSYVQKEPEVRRQVGVWLNGHGAHRRTLQLLPEAESLTRKDLLLVHLDALASVNQWKEVRRILERRDVALEEVYRQVFLARCATQEGNPSKAESHWRRARSEAANDLRKIWFVGDYAERAGELAQAAQVYRALTKNATIGRSAFDALLRVVSKEGDTVSVRDVLAEMRKQFPQDPAVENDLAYFNLLLEQEIEDARITAEKQRAAAPENLAHRTTLALALCRQNRPAAALQVYEGLQVPWDRVSQSQRAIHAAVLGLNGDAERARGEVASLSLETLRPEETKLIEPWIPR